MNYNQDISSKYLKIGLKLRNKLDEYKNYLSMDQQTKLDLYSSMVVRKGSEYLLDESYYSYDSSYEEDPILEGAYEIAKALKMYCLTNMHSSMLDSRVIEIYRVMLDTCLDSKVQFLNEINIEEKLDKIKNS